jgi:hypothetical protein
MHASNRHPPEEEHIVELLLIVTTIVAGLVGFDLVAMRFGVDTRESIGDDRIRSTHS